MESDIDPDMIVVEMEKISVMFERWVLILFNQFTINCTYLLFRIKKGCLLEVEVTTTIMAKVLTDIFPASYVLMRVVGEFLSPNQPHPTYMCTVVNQVCNFFLCIELQKIKTNFQFVDFWTIDKRITIGSPTRLGYHNTKQLYSRPTNTNGNLLSYQFFHKFLLK